MKLGVIVPYRKRPSHLRKFQQSIREYLTEYDYELIIVEQSDDLPFNFAVKASGSVVLLSILFIGISHAAGSAALAACSMALGTGGLGVLGVEFYKHSKRQEVLDNAVEDRNQLRAKGIDPDVTIDDLVVCLAAADLSLDVIKEK